MDTLITVDGTTLPTPSRYYGEVSDIVDSGRNANGVIVSDVVRYNVGKVYLEWNFLKPSKLSDILQLFNRTFVHTVKYLDCVTNTYVTKQMYVGNRNSGDLKTSDGKIIGYADVKFNLIEV